jgi:hypothetical protein
MQYIKLTYGLQNTENDKMSRLNLEKGEVGECRSSDKTITK